jgi:hypothetical protein
MKWEIKKASRMHFAAINSIYKQELNDLKNGSSTRKNK